MVYLEQSTRARDAAVAERERQRNAELERERHDREQAEHFAEQQRRVAQRLRRFTFALVLISLLAVVAAGVSVYAFAKAKQNETLARNLAQEARASFTAEQAARKDSEAHRVAAETAQKKAEEERRHAQEEEKRAKEESQRADTAAKAAQRATLEQRAAAEREKKAADEAEAARDQAQRSAERLQLDSLSRNGLDSFQRGNYSGALYEFNMTDQMIRQKLDSDREFALLRRFKEELYKGGCLVCSCVLLRRAKAKQLFKLVHDDQQLFMFAQTALVRDVDYAQGPAAQRGIDHCFCFIRAQSGAGCRKNIVLHEFSREIADWIATWSHHGDAPTRSRARHQTTAQCRH